MAFTIGSGNRGVVLRQQTSFGTVGSGSLFFGLVDDESFQTTFDVNARADMTRYGAHTTKTGKRYGEGTINMAMDDSSFLALIMKGIFPVVATTGSSDPYTHTMTEIDHDAGRAGGTVFPVYQAIVLRDEKEHTYNDLSLDSISISGSVGEYVMLSATFMGKPEDSSSPSALSTEATYNPVISEPVHFQSAEVVFRSSTNTTASTSVSSVSLDISLNRDIDSSYALGSDTCVREAPPQLREISGSVEFITPIHATSVEEPLYGNLIDGGNSTKYQPGTSNPALTLTFTSTANHDVVITLYNLQWEAPTSNVSGRDTQKMSLNFTGLFDDTFGGMAKCVIRNALSAL